MTGDAVVCTTGRTLVGEGAPQVDVSSLGEAAVRTGALAIGLRTALDNVFVERPRRGRLRAASR